VRDRRGAGGGPGGCPDGTPEEPGPAPPGHARNLASPISGRLSYGTRREFSPVQALTSIKPTITSSPPYKGELEKWYYHHHSLFNGNNKT